MENIFPRGKKLVLHKHRIKCATGMINVSIFILSNIKGVLFSGTTTIAALSTGMLGFSWKISSHFPRGKPIVLY